MTRPSPHHEHVHDAGRIRISWAVSVGVVLAGVAVVAVVYGTHAFTILARIGLKIT